MANAQRTRETHGAAKAQLEAQGDKSPGLLPAAIEGMRDAARTGVLAENLAQLLEDRVLRTPHVQQYRQTEVTGDFQLLDEEIFLACRIEIRHEEIKADLTDSHRRIRPGQFALQPLTERGQIFLTGAVNKERMNAIGRNAAGIALAAITHGGKVARRHRRHDDCRYPGSPRAGCHRIAVSCEFGSVEMAVSVDQHENSAAVNTLTLTAEAQRRGGNAEKTGFYRFSLRNLCASAPLR